MTFAITNNIFQTHKSIRHVQSKLELRSASKTWKNNKAFKYQFYDDIQRHEFMSLFFPEIMDAYTRLPLGVMKADLWRYCIVYQYGGIYADIDTVLRTDPSCLTDYTDKNIIFVPQYGGAHNNIPRFCQWVFAAPPKSPI